MCADRDRELLDFIVQTLREADHRVYQAQDGLAALELSLALRHIDLLITNTYLPGLDGPQLIHRVRAQLPGLPILYIQNADAEHHGAPQGLPPDVPTLRQPFTADQLLEGVRPLLTRKP